MKTIYEFLLKSKTSVSIQGNDCVDLGLPSGLLWARCNIGADEPYEYGDYFMWGSTKPDTDKRCDWEHAPFNDGKSQFNDVYFESIKNKVCPNGTLAPKYDAATVILGKDWRLPTDEDFEELIDNTTQEWIKNYKDSNINGMIFKANGDELFIPAAGWRNVSDLYDRGDHGYLWSSSFNTSSLNYAKYFYFRDTVCHMYSSRPFNGFCLRGVKK